MFIAAIFVSLIGKEAIWKKIKDILLWILIAWVWIQSSWFVTAAIIDMGTVTSVAAGALSSQVISLTPGVSQTMKNTMPWPLDENETRIMTGIYLLFGSDDSKASSLLEEDFISLEGTGVTAEQMFDALLPKEWNLSWPLYYLWLGILRVWNVVSVDFSSEKWVKWTLLNVVLQWGTTIIFAIEIFVLFAFVVMRMIYLWMFIIMSPIVILILCMKQSKLFKTLWKSKGFISKTLNLKSFLLNVFKPSLIVLGMGIALIFVTLMSGIIGDDTKGKIYLDWVEVTTKVENTKNTDSKDRYTSQVDSSILKIALFNASKTFFEIIMSILTVVMVYFIIKVTMSIGKWTDFVTQKITWDKWLQGKVSKLMTSVPLVPVAWYDKDGNPKTKALSAGNVLGVGWKDGIISRAINNEISKANKGVSDQTDVILQQWWTRDYNVSWVWTNLDSLWTGKTWLAQLTARKDWIKSNSKKLKNGDWIWMTLSKDAGDKTFQNHFRERLKAIDKNNIGNDPQYLRYSSAWKNMINRVNTNENDNKPIEDMFSEDKKYVQAYAHLFWLANPENMTWDSLKNIDLSKDGIIVN